MRPPAVTMRVARASDAATMARSLALGFDTYRAFAPAGWSPPEGAGAAAIAERLATRGAWALLADVAGEPAGHVALYPQDGDRERTVYLWQLFVRPPWWGSGLAGALHAAFAEEARGRRYRCATLLTPAAHARARRFYERRGWCAAGPPDDRTPFGMPLVRYRGVLHPAAGSARLS